MVLSSKFSSMHSNVYTVLRYF